MWLQQYIRAMPKAGLIPTIRFNLKQHNKTKDISKDILIYLIMRVNGKKVTYSTGLKVKPKYWMGNKARVIKSHNQEYSILNDKLITFEQHAKAILLGHDPTEVFSIDAFKLELDYRSKRKERPTGGQATKTTLFDFIESYIEEEKTKTENKRGTWKKFITVSNNLKLYCKDRKRSLDFSDIDWVWRDDFVKWMYDKPRNFSANNAAKVLEVIKQFMNVSLRRRLHKNRTHLEPGFGVKRQKVQSKLRLNFDELKELIELDLSDNKRQEVVRDLFVVSCYSGLRFSDLHQISRKQIFKDESDELLEVLTEKTQQLVIIPILPELKAILEKYDYQLPMVSIQELNRIIKLVAKKVLKDKTFVRTYNKSGQTKSEVTERWTKVSSHCARRSFASNFYELGIQINDLMQITGHATEKQFFEYIDLDKRKRAKQFNVAVLVARKIQEDYLKSEQKKGSLPIQ